jgi:transposase
VLTENDLRLMYKLRHGSERRTDIDRIEMSIPDISKRLHISYSTVHYALKRYERQGCRFINLRSGNWKKAWVTNTKIKGAVKTYLLSHKVLTEWAGKSLPSRVKEIKAHVGLNIHPRTLSKFYRENKVNRVVVKYQYQQAIHQDRAKVRTYVLGLARRVIEGQNLIYFDETSCNQWMRSRMTWSCRSNPVKMHLTAKRGSGVTVLGAIGMGL